MPHLAPMTEMDVAVHAERSRDFLAGAHDALEFALNRHVVGLEPAQLSILQWFNENADTLLGKMQGMRAVTTPQRVALSVKLRYWHQREKQLRRESFLSRRLSETFVACHGAVGEKQRYSKWHLASSEKFRLLYQLLHVPPQRHDMPSSLNERFK